MQMVSYKVRQPKTSLIGIILVGVCFEIYVYSGKLAITEDIMTDLVYTKISWVRDKDVTPITKKVEL